MTKLLTITFLVTSLLCSSQDFEGTIEYDLSFEKLDKNIPMKIEEIEEYIGTKSTYITKEGSFKQISEGKFMAYQVYKSSENKLYYKDIIGNDTIFFKDLSKYENTAFEYEIIRNADTILNYVCHKLIYNTQDSEEHFYFAPELKQNPDFFRGFAFGNKNKLTELMKSVFLRYDVISYGLKIKTIATEVKIQSVKDEEFVIPQNVVIMEK